MEKLYIFNPETEMALAANKDSYTPPQNICNLRKKNALLPVLYADEYSSILIPSDCQVSDYTKEQLELSEHKHLKIIKESQLKDKDWEIHPWGWNRSLRTYLLRNGVNEISLPTFQYLERLRNLAHRRTTIEIQRLLCQRIPEYEIDLPIEFCDENVAFEWASKNLGAYMKAPWSSSGRGIYHSEELFSSSMKRWIHGVVSRQGSVIGEIGLDRSLDFATEWVIKDSSPYFLGFSVFETGANGQYKGNKLASEKELEDIIKSKSSLWSRAYLDVMKDILREVIVPYYSGFLGIDMLVSTDGRINLCVEINLRMTMGHVALEVWKNNHQRGFVGIEI